MRWILLAIFATACSVPTLPPTPLPTATPTPTAMPTFTPTPTPATSVPVPAVRATPFGRLVCADAPLSPFQVGDQARQCMTEGLIVRVRPSLRAQVIAVVRNARFQIIGGPECGNQRVWWRIETFDRSVRGWVPETDPGGSERYLCPFP